MFIPCTLFEFGVLRRLGADELDEPNMEICTACGSSVGYGLPDAWDVLLRPAALPSR